jgi:natural product precursor
MKKFNKKLDLKKLTIAQLTGEDMDAVRGGVSIDSNCDSCVTIRCCHTHPPKCPK